MRRGGPVGWKQAAGEREIQTSNVTAVGDYGDFDGKLQTGKFMAHVNGLILCTEFKFLPLFLTHTHAYVRTYLPTYV